MMSNQQHATDRLISDQQLRRERAAVIGWWLHAAAVAACLLSVSGCAALTGMGPSKSCRSNCQTDCPVTTDGTATPDCQSSSMNLCGCGLGNCGSCMARASCAPVAACPTAPAMGYAPIMPVVHNAYGTDPNEFLCNGGDRPPTTIVKTNDTFDGLNISDTVVHYTTEGQDIELSASNPVCLYAPRFASVRKVTGAVAGQHAVGLSAARHRTIASGVEIEEGGVLVTDTLELAHAEVTRRIDAMRDRNRGVPIDAVQQVIQQTDVLAAIAGIGLHQLAAIEKEQRLELQRFANAAVSWTVDASVEAAIADIGTPTIQRAQAAEGFTVYDFPDAGRLEILKLADRHDALPGDKVSFAITVRNVGDSPVNRVTLADNLTTRLEYVTESQTCSGGANFETARNDAGSEKLTWTLTDELKVGESVTIRFQCKVR